MTLPHEVGYRLGSFFEVPEGFRVAQGFLKEASRVCFLGFGYDKRNVERLGLENVSRNATLDLAFWCKTKQERLDAAIHVRSIVPREVKPAPDVVTHCGNTKDGILGVLRNTDMLS